MQGLQYYPMPVTAGTYDGQIELNKNVVIKFYGNSESSDENEKKDNSGNYNSTHRLSPLHDNQAGLFTAVNPGDTNNDFIIRNFTFRGEVAGSYFPAALISGVYPGTQMRSIYGGRLNISNIELDGVLSKIGKGSAKSIKEAQIQAAKDALELMGI